MNIDGSYECKCKKGFVGDGHLSCERTCYEDCVHGKVQCISDLLTLEGIETIPIIAITVLEFQVRDTYNIQYNFSYRVSHSEVCKVNQLWGVEGSIILKNYGN